MKLELKNINYEHIKTRPTLSDVSFTIENGEKVTLMSVLGGGKSTLVRLILGMYSDFDGQILIDDIEIENISAKNRNALVIFDDYMLKNRKTVREEIQKSLKSHEIPSEKWEEKIENALAFTGLDGFQNKKIADLSREERFFVALSRGLSWSPSIIIFDTPFCAMSEEEKQNTKAKLKALLPKLSCSTIFTTDEIPDGDYFQNRVIVLNDGKISFDGSFEQSPYHNVGEE